MFGLLGSIIVGGIMGGVGGGLIGYAIGCIIDEFSIKQAIQEEEPDAFKALIKAKKQNAVKVGIFSEENEHIQDFEIESEEGVSDSIYKGQTIYIY